MQFMTDSLKNEITQILERYNIPMDDRTMILEKVEGEIGSLATAVGKQVQLERAAVREQMDGFHSQAKNAFGDLLGKSKGAVKRAYAMGYKEGIGQAPAGPSFFQIAITVGLLGLAAFVVIREIWPKKD